MVTVKRIAPVFPVADLAAGFDHYRRLGFSIREYGGGGYGYATRGDVEIHLAAVRDLDPKTTTSAAYLWVDDADALADEWQAAGVRVGVPRDTAWGQHEGTHLDPDGNLLRFGSPMGRPAR
jgi:hypothetical protein